MEHQKTIHQRWLFLFLLLFRLSNALLVQTYFNPDEYWQSLEVAHRLVFGYGYITWEWREAVRGYAHPLLFAALFKLLALVGLDSPAALRIAPRLLQGAFAACGDLFLHKLTARIFSARAAKWALVCQLLNWFTFFCIVRPFSNCLETVLTTAALFYWPLDTDPNPHNAQPPVDSKLDSATNQEEPQSKQQGSRALCDQSSAAWQVPARGQAIGTGCQGVNRPLALVLAGLACVFRPTSAVLWAYLGARELSRARDKGRLVREVLSIGSACLGLSTVVDRWMYGRWTVVPWNFVRFNLGGGAAAYGTHPWHWYVTGGLPAMATSLLPFALIGIWQCRKRALAEVIVWVLAAYSLLGHKEFRFILPVLPLVMAYAGQALATLESSPTPNDWRSAQRSRSLSPASNPEPYAHPSNEQLEPQLLQTEACGSSLRNRKKPNPSTTAQKPLKSPLETTAATPANLSTDFLNPFLTLPGTTAEEPPNPFTEAPNPAKPTAAKPPNPFTEAPNPAKPAVATAKAPPKGLLASLIFLVVTQVPMAFYFSMVHQRGAVKVMEYLAGEAQGGRVSGAWFLMPCHSTPFYSHLHVPIPMRILDCSPSSEPGHVREDDLFFHNPVAFLVNEFELRLQEKAGSASSEVVESRRDWHDLIGTAAEGRVEGISSHVVLFEPLNEALEGLLLQTGYAKGPRFFHSHFPVDRELQSHMVVYILRSSEEG